MERLEPRFALAVVTVGTGGDYVDLNAALADSVNVPAGSTINVLPGTYTAAKSVQNQFQALYRIDRPLTIRAADPGAMTKLALPDFSADPIKPDSVVKIAADGVTIDGLTLDGGAGVWAAVLGQNHSNLVVTNNRFGAGVDNGVILLGVSQATVSANIVEGAVPQRGIWASSSQSITVTSNVIGSALAGPMAEGVFIGGGTMVTVQGNTITNAGTGVFVTEQSPAVTIKDNIIAHSAGAGVYIADRSHDGAITGNTITDSGDSAVTVNGGSLRASVTGNTVTAAMQQGIIVTGASHDATISTNAISSVSGSGIYVNGGSANAQVNRNTINSSGTNGVTINGASANASLAGNTISGAGLQGIFVTGASIGAVVTNNDITATGGAGIYVDEASANAAVLANTLAGCWVGVIVTGSSSEPVIRGNTITLPGDHGILVTGQSDGAVVAGNTVSSATKSAIYVQNAADAVVGGPAGDRNTIASPADNGIVVENGPRARVTNNKVSSAGKQGVLVTTGSVNVVVRGNEISAPGLSGVYVAKQSTAVAVDANTITDSAGRGVIVDDGCHQAVVTANEITRTGFEGIFVTNASNGVRVEFNTIQSTAAAGIYVDNASTGIILRSNAVSDTGKDGIALIGGIDDGFVTNNTLQRSGVNGIHVSGSSRLWLQGNTISDSGNLPSPSGAFEGSGIYLANRSMDNYVVLNTVRRVRQDSGIILNGGSNGNAVVENAFDNLGFSGVLVVNSSFNQIEGNTVVDPRIEGYVLTLNAVHNVVRFNSVTYSAFSTAGAGLWINDFSQHNRLSMNYAQGSAENGIAIFQSSHNYIDGNTTERNKFNGVYISRFAEADDPHNSLPEAIPQGNVVVGNYSLNDLANGRLIVRAGVDTEFSRNFAYTTDRRPGTSGFVVDGASSDTRFFGNNFVNLEAHGFVIENARETLFVRNRFLQTSQAQANPGVSVAWDGGPALGGNFWSQFGTSGNPSNGSTPFTDFVPVVTPATADAYPFQAESLGYATTVSIFSPVAGTTMAPGSNRTISWVAPAATWVQISIDGPAGAIPIAARAPNTGLYWWKVPVDLQPGEYAVRITPLDDAGTVLGPGASSAGFRVDGDSVRSVRFAAPLQDRNAAAGSTIRAAWTGTGVSAVDFDIQIDGEPWQTVVSGVSTPYADITLPAVSSRAVRLRVRDPATGISDTMDGSFTVSTAAAAFTASPVGTVAVGSQQRLDWVSPIGSTRVKLEYTDGRGQPATIVADMVDVRSYTWMVPDAVGSTSVALTFLDVNGAVISKLTSPTFFVPGQGAPVRFVDPGSGPINQAPTNIVLSAASIAENNSIGQVVGTLSTTDPDSGDTSFTYALVSGDGGADNDAFAIEGDQLKAAVVFDFEGRTSYSIRIRSTDAAGGSFERAFTIGVIDVAEPPTNTNTPPTDISLSATNIAENNVIGAVIGTLSTTDADTGDTTFTYALASGDGAVDNAAFVIEGNQLKAATVFNFEVRASYSIRVRSTDPAGGSVERVFTIAVTDVENEQLVVERVAALVPGSYRAGQRVRLSMTLSEAVQVVGKPRVQVRVGGATRTASYVSGSSTPTLTFEYVVGRRGNSDVVAVGQNLVLTKKNSIAAGTKTLATALPAGIAGSIVEGVRFDAVAPKAVGKVEAPGSGTFTIGQSLDFVVRFSEVVVVTGTPQIALTGLAGARKAIYVAGSGSQSITFRYVIQAGDALRGTKGLGLARSIAISGGATINDDAGNRAVPKISIPSLKGIRIATA